MRLIVLGSAAGGGVPQWNCRCPVCTIAWEGNPRVKPRSQSSLAASADGKAWVILNASPDLRSQILATAPLHPHQARRHSPIVAVVLTNADVDHTAGLLTLRERQPFDLYATHAILDLIAADPIFAVLDAACVTPKALKHDVPQSLPGGLGCRPFKVPGKVPLYLETGLVEIGLEGPMTTGLELASEGHGRVVYIPGCAAVDDRLLARIDGADALFFDGTLFEDDEMIRLGLSHKSGLRMGHIPISGPGGSLEALSSVRVGRKFMTHLNNTNPVLIEDSPERALVESAGWEIAYDGLDIVL